ncbi:MAG: class I SAM-dependent methyltransferase [Candidatus Dormibacter sp.]
MPAISGPFAKSLARPLDLVSIACSLLTNAAADWHGSRTCKQSDNASMTRRPGLADYEGIAVPPLVHAAVEATRAAGYPLACTSEVGRLLHLLAAHQPGGRLGELGTAYGVGAAWLATGMCAGARLHTVEIDAGRASAATALFADRSDVIVIRGDWSHMRTYAPFDLLFSDGGPKREPEAPTLLRPLLRPGGLLVLDDYTPESAWTEEQRKSYQNDVSRRIWLENPEWSAQELQLSKDISVILAVRFDEA